MWTSTCGGACAVLGPARRPRQGLSSLPDPPTCRTRAGDRPAATGPQQPRGQRREVRRRAVVLDLTLHRRRRDRPVQVRDGMASGGSSLSSRSCRPDGSASRRYSGTGGLAISKRLVSLINYDRRRATPAAATPSGSVRFERQSGGGPLRPPALFAAPCWCGRQRDQPPDLTQLSSTGPAVHRRGPGEPRRPPRARRASYDIAILDMKMPDGRLALGRAIGIPPGRVLLPLFRQRAMGRRPASASAYLTKPVDRVTSTLPGRGARRGREGISPRAATAASCARGRRAHCSSRRTDQPEGSGADPRLGYGRGGGGRPGGLEACVPALRRGAVDGQSAGDGRLRVAEMRAREGRDPTSAMTATR
jgi:hypothetical protein